MSASLMGQVWEIELAAPEQQVMLALADHGSSYPDTWGYGYDIFPSVKLLAWKTGKTERHIQRILRTLENMRVIVPVAFAKGGRGHATKYEMHLEAGRRKTWDEAIKGDIQGLTDEAIKGDISTQSTKEGLKGDIQGLKGDIQGLKGDIQGLKGDIAMSPEPSENHHNNHQRTITRARARGATDSHLSMAKNENAEAEAEPDTPVAEPPPVAQRPPYDDRQFRRWALSQTGGWANLSPKRLDMMMDEYCRMKGIAG